MERDRERVAVQLAAHGVGAVGLIGAARGQRDLAGAESEVDGGVAGGDDGQPFDRLGQLAGVQDRGGGNWAGIIAARSG